MIESKTARRFWDAFADLPDQVKRDAKEAYRMFQMNPAHPTLHFKKLEGQDRIYSVRIGLGYRALGAMKGSRCRLVLDWKPRRLRPKGVRLRERLSDPLKSKFSAGFRPTRRASKVDGGLALRITYSG